MEPCTNSGFRAYKIDGGSVCFFDWEPSLEQHSRRQKTTPKPNNHETNTLTLFRVFLTFTTVLLFFQHVVEFLFT
jgi:hypothetical protein